MEPDYRRRIAAALSRAAIHAASSTDRQEVENQLAQMRRFADSQNWENHREYIEHETGKHADRSLIISGPGPVQRYRDAFRYAVGGQRVLFPCGWRGKRGASEAKQDNLFRFVRRR